jgi:propanediol utilization protein
MELPIHVQHRHVHLSQEDIQRLFGDIALLPSRFIDQHEQFICQQQVSVHGPSGSFPEVAIIGPARSRTQVELSASDAFAIGVDAPVRLSGDLDRSATVILKTDHGEVRATMSTIIPIRHLHLPPRMADSLGVAHHDVVSLHVKGREDVIFHHVVVRLHPTFTPALHLTKDEAAPTWIQSGDIAIL